MSTPTPLWSPSSERIAAANITRFIQRVNVACGARLTDYASLYQWSIEHREEFWAELWSFCGVRASRKYTSVIENGDAMPGAKWFVGSELNFAENLLARDDDTIALIFVMNGPGVASFPTSNYALKWRAWRQVSSALASSAAIASRGSCRTCPKPS